MGGGTVTKLCGFCGEHKPRAAVVDDGHGNEVSICAECNAKRTPIECDRCREVGLEACAAERERFKREPFLVPCFDLGAQWTSHDKGATWTRFPPAENGWRGGDKLTVIAINADRGEVTFKVHR